MLDAVEKWSVQSLVDYYPQWWATKHIVSLGQRFIQQRVSYRFDKRLILTKHPTILDRIKAGYAYARYMTLQGNQYLIEATADALFINTYFLNKRDAIAFATSIHYPRYLVALWKQAWQEIISLLFHQTDSGTPTYLLMAVTLEVLYHVDGDEWIQTENIDLAPPTEEELSQI